MTLVGDMRHMPLFACHAGVEIELMTLSDNRCARRGCLSRPTTKHTGQRHASRTSLLFESPATATFAQRV